MGIKNGQKACWALWRQGCTDVDPHLANSSQASDRDDLFRAIWQGLCLKSVKKNCGNMKAEQGRLPGGGLI